MKKVTIEGNSYLGAVKVDGDVTILTKAMMVNSLPVNQNEFIKYVQLKNSNELQRIEFTGVGVASSVSDLTLDEKLAHKIAKLAMKRAKISAVSNVENQQMEEFLPKK